MPTEETSESTSLDGALGGTIKLLQPRKGYRFSIDALLLADFAAPARGRVLDLGTGCGVVLLAIAGQSADLTAGVGVEVQQQLAELARQNVGLNQLESRLSIIQSDWRALSTLGLDRYDLVVSNPPYRPLHGARLSPSAGRAIARHEVMGGLEDMVAAAAAMLGPEGRFCVVYPADQYARLTATLAANQLHPAKVRWVHPHAEDPVELVLLEARLGVVESAVELPRLVLHREDGRPTEEAERIMGPSKSAR